MIPVDAGGPDFDVDAAGLDLIETTVRRLAAEFPDRFVLTDVVDTVVRAHADLDGHGPEAALPELVERLARMRLLTS